MANVKYLSYDGLKKFTSSIGQTFASELKGTTATDSISIYPVAKYKEYNESTGVLSASYSEKALPGVSIPLAGATGTNAGLVTSTEYTKLKNLDSNHWYSINTITPGSPKSTLTITGGKNVTVTTTTASNLISFSSSDIGLSSDGSGNAITAITASGHSIKYTLGKTFSETGHTHSAYVNQNAFSNIRVGSTTVAADSTTDTVTFVAGDYMTITASSSNDSITFTGAGVGVSSDGTGNVVTSITSSGHGITYTKGINVYQKSETYSKTEVDGIVDSAMVSALEYKGTISSATSSPGAFTPAATQGNVYVVTGSGYINGISVEEGDMFLCSATSVAAATSSNYSTIQDSWNIVNVNWNVVLVPDDDRKLPQDGQLHEICKIGGHPISLGVQTNTTTGSVSASQKPSHGDTFNIITGGSFSGNNLTFSTSTVKLPSETILSVNPKTGTDIPGSHGGSFNVVTGITGSGHTVTYTVSKVTLPAETTLTKGKNVTATKSPAHGGTFTALTDFTVSGHTITATVTTYTLPSVPDVSVTAGTSTPTSPKHGDTFNVVTGIAENGHGITVNTSQVTLPSVISYNATSPITLSNDNKFGLSYLTESTVTGSFDSTYYVTYNKLGLSNNKLATVIENVTSAEIDELFA